METLSPGAPSGLLSAASTGKGVQSIDASGMPSGVGNVEELARQHFGPHTGAGFSPSRAAAQEIDNHARALFRNRPAEGSLAGA